MKKKCNNSAFYILHSALCGGFTLIELMVVVVVIAILMGITLPIAKYVSQRAREANQKIMIEKIRSALEDYRAAYGEYPITPDTNSMPQAIITMSYAIIPSAMPHIVPQ